MRHRPPCDLAMEVENAECTCMVPLSVAVDAVLCKLSEAKAGDVLVLTADNYATASLLSQELGRIRLPAGTLPKGGIPIVIRRRGVDWTLERSVQENK